MGRDPRPSYRLGQVVPEHGAGIEAYCLLTTHVHLLVAVRDGALSALMRDLNGRYVRAFNKRHGRRGPLLDRRFPTTLVKDDAHAISCLRYIARNPIEAGVCKRERDWRWSSHRALAGIASRPAFLTRFILGEGPEAAARYRELFES